jgi:Xaa-Pro dipeptidase/ectoine hydrolase
MPISRGPQAFPRSEYMHRLAKVKAEMGKRQLRAILVTDPANITYLTGYTAHSAYVPQGLIVDAEEEEPFFIVRKMDAPAGIYQTFLDRAQVLGYPEDLVANKTRNGYDVIIERLVETGAAKGRIGLEFELLSHAALKQLSAKLETEDVTGVVTWLRLVKSDLEIAVMREAAAIADAAMLRGVEVIRPGVREADAAAEIYAQLARGANGKAGTNLAQLAICAGSRTGTSHIAWADETFKSGTHVNIELGGVRHGYVSALMRTVSLGKPSDRLKRIHDAELAGLEAALAAARVGNTAGQVADAFYAEARKHGVEKESRCGYAIGINWTEVTASLKSGDPTVLAPNMTFHLMLGNWIDEDFGYAISETFRVTASGGEALGQTPRLLFEV